MATYSPIASSVAADIVTRYHYLHRRPPISEAYCARDDLGNVVGVCTLGVPPSHTLLKGVCGPEHAHEVYELNRLWIADGQPRNSASALVGYALRNSARPIIVSFADTGVGHVGYVYQATNFLYCGMSAKFSDVVADGKHQASFKGMTNAEIYAANPHAVKVERSRKHRYVYIKGPMRKRLRAALRYEVMPYPKGDTTNADTPSLSASLFEREEPR